MTSVTSSRIFDFIEQRSEYLIERYEVASIAFGSLRRSLREIAKRLGEADGEEARDFSDRIRTLLFEWLTVPVPFDDSILDAVKCLGDAAVIGTRWGRDIQDLYEAASNAAKSVQSDENPVRTKLRDVICEQQAKGRVFKIYCHRRAQQHFESLFIQPGDAAIGAAAFMHSVRDYRESEPFEVLIKVGPLRSWGWGSAPDALITAPRFAILVQILWSGCSNESGFGYDPVAPLSNAVAANGKAPVADQVTQGNRTTWETHVTRSGDDFAFVPGGVPDDDFEILRQPGRTEGRHPATLIQTGDEHGILYPPFSQVLSFDPAPSADGPLERRLPGETLVEGMFVILPSLGDVDLVGLQAGDGQFSREWKDRLRQELTINPGGICRLLRNNGVQLAHLRSCVENWSRPPTTVIHAPQKARDFEVLIRVLGVDFDPNRAAHARFPWWQYAWNEIRQSRGEAIQTGLHEHEIVDEQLLDILNHLLPEIEQTAGQKAEFRLPIPQGSNLQGNFLFFRISGIEQGFLAPDTELKVLRDLNTIEQWRA